MTATSSSAPQSTDSADPFTLRVAPRPDGDGIHPAAAGPAVTTAALSGSATASAVTGSAVDAEEPSIGQLVSDASAHVSTLVRSEIELAKLELRATVKNAGVGIGLFGAAAAILVFSLVFAFLTLAEGLTALGLARWLSFLIVFVFQLLLVGVFAFLGFKKVKKVKAPERTIRTTKETVGYLKSHAK